MKFIHAADLHIDSPLEGLTQYEGAPLDRLRDATRRALTNLVDLARDEKVDFVLVAGDLFDRDWQDMRTGLFTAGEFRRLREAAIPVFIAKGNHDAASQMCRKIVWPENVVEFSTRKAETHRLDELGVAIHGRSFATAAEEDDPLPRYPDAVAGMFNIGVLHTNVGGTKGHDRYAPTTLDGLRGKGYDYWALGHIHARRVFCENPYIAYSGNTQGRHVNEPGEKGCLLVSVQNGRARAEFKPLDVIRWHRIEIELQPCHDLPEVYALVQQRLRQCREESGNRLAAVRLTLRGPCAAHRNLLRPGQREVAAGNIHDQANGFGEDVWIEDIRWETQPPVALDSLRQGGDLLGDLLRCFESLRQSPEELEKLAETLTSLEENRAGVLENAKIQVRDPECLRRWLDDAEAILLGHLAGAQS